MHVWGNNVLQIIKPNECTKHYKMLLQVNKPEYGTQDIAKSETIQRDIHKASKKDNNKKAPKHKNGAAEMWRRKVGIINSTVQQNLNSRSNSNMFCNDWFRLPTV